MIKFEDIIMFHPFHINLSSFELSILASQYNHQHQNPYNQLDKTQNFKNLISKSLQENYINVSEIEKEFFPLIDAHIFISHSHADISEATKLANFLYSNFGLKCFIDAIFWKNVDDIINELLSARHNISDAYRDPSRKPPDKSISAEDIKKNCSHAYMILAMSLLKIIDKTEVFFFLNSTNSTTLNPQTSQIATKSPWISMELLSTEILRRKPISSHRRIKNVFESANFNESKSFFYPIDLSNLTTISIENLHVWRHKRIQPSYSTHDESNLDKLYLIKSISLESA